MFVRSLSLTHFTNIRRCCVPDANTDCVVPPRAAVTLHPVHILGSSTVFTRRQVGVIAAVTHVLAYVRLRVWLAWSRITVDVRFDVGIGRRHHCQASVRLTWPFPTGGFVWPLTFVASQLGQVDDALNATRVAQPHCHSGCQHVVAATTGRAGACGCWKELDNPGLNSAHHREKRQLSIKGDAACLHDRRSTFRHGSLSVTVGVCFRSTAGGSSATTAANNYDLGQLRPLTRRT